MLSDRYARHKPIRNKLKEFTPESIIVHAISKLHAFIDPADPTKWGGYKPWDLLLLIRWTYQYSEPGVGLKAITDNEFIQLLNAVGDLNDGIALEGQGEGLEVPIFMRRTLAFQLPYQIQPHEMASSLGRQLVLFTELGKRFGLDARFKEYTGLTLREYFDIYTCCLSCCLVGDVKRLSLGYFAGKFPNEQLRAFFDLLSDNIESGKQFVRSYTSLKASIHFQLNEHTPLERRPFFRAGNLLPPYSEKLLRSSFRNNAYDIFKEQNSNFSRDSFGRIFEQYIGKGLAYVAPQKLYNEKELQALLPKDSKGPDFLAMEDGAAVFIEAKSTELHPIARVVQSKESILSNIESTILKAVIQIQTAAAHLRNSKFLTPETKTYGVVVTYKEYLIGDGGEFWKNIAGERVEQELKKLGIDAEVPPGQIFYMAVEDFDWMVAAAKEEKRTLSSLLAYMAEQNAQGETRCLIAAQHLSKLFTQYYRPAYVDEAFKSCFDDIEDRFS